MASDPDALDGALGVEEVGAVIDGELDPVVPVKASMTGLNEIVLLAKDDVEFRLSLPNKDIYRACEV